MTQRERLFKRLRRLGHRSNLKRVDRVYCRLKLNKRPQRQTAVANQESGAAGGDANDERMLVSRLHEQCVVNGRRFRTFNVVDDFNREATPDH